MLNPQAWADVILNRFRSLPFYLVAILLHVLFFLVFGTYEVSHASAGVVSVFTAPDAKADAGPVAPPPPPPSEIKETKLVKSPTTSAATTVRPTMIAAPTPNAAVVIPTPQISAPTVQQDFGKNLAKSLANVKVAGIYSARMTGSARGTAMRTGGGTEKGEGAVLRALHWLKEHQNPDGSWGGHYKPSMTGLALLTFLAHGERQDSAAYGETVQKGVQYLMEVGRKSKDGRLANEHVEYQHAIATYALSEDYALTQIGDLLDVLEKAVLLIVKSQAPNGSWDYGYNAKGREDPKRPGGDTSIVGWNVQALKAAKLAGVKAPGLDECMNKALGFLRWVYDEKDRRFGYGTKGKGSDGLLGVGILCMNFLNAGDSKEVRGALSSTRNIQCNWGKAGEGHSYIWYYITQAMFQSGGSYWIGWNRQFRDEIIRHQRADGSWPVPGTSVEALTGDAKGGWRQVADPKDQQVYHTTMLCMTLEVYYRFLPTFK